MSLSSSAVARIKEIKNFPALLRFLRDDLAWPIETTDVEDLTFDYTPEELGFDKKMAVKIRSIKQLRPMVNGQPWGIFYIDFEPKRLPVGALRRLLRSLVVKKRGGGDGSQASWKLNDLLFISFHGEEDSRTVAFAHFQERAAKQPQLRTFYWDQRETEFLAIAESLGSLRWPSYAESDVMADNWRKSWGAAFRAGHGEVIRDSRALSKKLAQVALKIRQHVADLIQSEDAVKGPLHRMYSSFKRALLHDLTEARFADVLAQTFTYGLLAAKAEMGSQKLLEPGHLAEQIPATNPLLRELFEEFQNLTGVGLDKLDEDLGDLGVDELVDLLNTVDVDEALKNFGRTTMSGQEDPVVHFYEEFLKDYDKEQKVERGVFYTPKPVVSFIVHSIHEILQREFGLEDGLASTATWDDMVAKHKDLDKPEGIRGDEPFVQILDPAVGTGTFLEACIQLIYDTLATKWSRAGKDVRTEWNSYVPEHLLPRLHGFELMMAPYVVCHMKLGLRLKELGYDFQSGERLRVYLTNTLEPPVLTQESLIGLVDSVAHEAHQANAIKKEVRMTAILGNPPYSNFGQLNKSAFVSELLRDYKHGLNERKINLDDDFIKFVALCQTKLMKSQSGVLGLITNNVFFDGLTHRRMRQSLLESFEEIRIVDLHGNVSAQESFDGKADENVFDIRQGVGITLASRLSGLPRRVASAHLQGTREQKYQWLGAHSTIDLEFHHSLPQTPGFLFDEVASSDDSYAAFVPLTEIFRKHAYGIQSKRDAIAYAFTSDEIVSNARFLLDHTDSEVRRHFGLPADGRDWSISWARADIKRLNDIDSHVRRVWYRPFDSRFTIFTGKSKGFVAYPRADTLGTLFQSRTVGLVSMRQVFQEIESYTHFGVTDVAIDERTFYSNRGGTYVFPLRIDESPMDFEGDPFDAANFAPAVVMRLRAVVGAKELTPESAFFYFVAVSGSPAFQLTYRMLLKREFPRLPLPSTSALFEELSVLGRQLSMQQLMEAPLESVAKRFIGEPAKALVARPSFESGTIWISEEKNAGFSGVDQKVWLFTLGGYQPCQKWLKDRKGRILAESDIRHYEQMLYAIEQTIRIMGEIDEVIESHGGWPRAFQGGPSVD